MSKGVLRIDRQIESPGGQETARDTGGETILFFLFCLVHSRLGDYILLIHYWLLAQLCPGSSDSSGYSIPSK